MECWRFRQPFPRWEWKVSEDGKKEKRKKDCDKDRKIGRKN